ncbi:hypothetical protein VNTUMSATTG_61350 (plasmid) [Vibrio nigripulchritudo]|uniref:hypothetical protein n=1 Tax=Vibrio nigripulchritudo TaxID=28173 RepID=UPI00190A440C|nr:hypothetical protein [Vibrio nigripulchritudo]BCL74198.1 hypothetical protein VNTUMSATTG_61350 [Vibrio nigripulchritudo]
MSSISLEDYLVTRYGIDVYGNRKAFLEDNPRIKGSELSRWIKKGYKVDLGTGDIFSPSNKKVIIKPALPVKKTLSQS